MVENIIIVLDVVNDFLSNTRNHFRLMNRTIMTNVLASYRNANMFWAMTDVVVKILLFRLLVVASLILVLRLFFVIIADILPINITFISLWVLIVFGMQVSVVWHFDVWMHILRVKNFMWVIRTRVCIGVIFINCNSCVMLLSLYVSSMHSTVSVCPKQLFISR